MPQSLGTLFVDLQANTGGFVSALSKAAYSAQTAAKGISRDFRDLGGVASQTFGAFGDFNPAISKLSFALETTGRAASSAMRELGKSGGILGPVAALTAGAGAGFLALGGIIIGIATHAAEGAARMYELSQATGVPVGTLSGLSFAAKAAGVDVQTLATGLERMNKSAFAAAIAPAGTANAYTRLGISLRDAGGNLRPTQDLLLDLADKFSKMQDGVEKTADAIAIFGRGGAALIPFLNEGKASIAEIVEYASQVGAILSGPAAAGAHEFERTLSMLGIAAQGLENRLMVDLLPALQQVAQAAASWLADSKNQETLKNIADSAGAAARSLLNLADAFIFVGRAAAAFWQLTSGWDAFSPTKIKAFNAELRGAYEQMQKFALITPGEFLPKGEQFAPGQSAFFGGFDPGKLGILNAPRPAPSAPAASGRPDVVAELVAKLQAQAAAELALASATEKSAAATLLAKAAGDAETKIAETRASLLAQEKSLREQLADAKSDEAAGELSGGTRTLKISAEIAGVQKLLAELQKDAPQIRTLYAEMASGEFGAKAAKDLEEFANKTNEEAEAARSMATAFSKGGLAVQDALDAAKIAPFEKKLADLGELIGRMKQASIPTGPVGSSSVVGSLFGNLQQSYDQLAGAIGRAKTAVASFTVAEIAKAIAKEKEQLTSEAHAYGVLAQAALKSAQAQREAAAQAAAIRFGAEHPSATPEQLKDVYGTELQRQNQEQTLTVARASVQFDPAAGYAQEIEKLQEIKSFLESAGESTIAIDTAIYQARIAHIEDYQRRAFEAQNQELLGQQKIYQGAIQMTEQWDQAANEVGTLGEKFRAMANEIQLESVDMGGKIFDTFKKGIDDLSGTLAKFVVTGKANWGEFFASILEGLIKIEVQFAVSKGFQWITGGLQNKPQSTTSGFPGIPTGEGAGNDAHAATGLTTALAGMFGIKLPGAPGAAGGAGLPSSVATMTVAAQMVNVNGGISTTGGPTSSGFPGIPTGAGADGTSGSPFTSIIADSSGNPFDTSNAIPVMFSGGTTPSGASGDFLSSFLPLSGGGSGAGPLGSIFSSMSGPAAGGGLSDLLSMGSDAADAGAGAADAGSSLLDILPDFFMADGGRVSSGTPYIVGEKNAEVFVPDQAGRIVPSIGQFVNSSLPTSLPGYPSSAGGSPSGSDLHLHLYGVTDADSFALSKGQIFADMQEQLAMSHYRNRGGRSNG